MKLTLTDLETILKNLQKNNGPCVSYAFGWNGVDWDDPEGKIVTRELVTRINRKLKAKAKKNGSN